MSDDSGSQSQIGSLQYGSLQNSLATLTPEAQDKPAISPRSTYAAVAVLCYVNLVNYIERYTIAGTQSFFSFVCLFWGGTCNMNASCVCQSNMSQFTNRRPSQYSSILCYKWWHSCASANRYMWNILWLKINPSYDKPLMTEKFKSWLTCPNVIICVYLQCLFAVSYSWLLSLVTLATATTGRISWLLVWFCGP